MRKVVDETFTSKGGHLYKITMVSEGNDYQAHYFTARWECARTKRKGALGYSIPGCAAASREAQHLIEAEESAPVLRD